MHLKDTDIEDRELFSSSTMSTLHHIIAVSITEKISQAYLVPCFLVKFHPIRLGKSGFQNLLLVGILYWGP